MKNKFLPLLRIIIVFILGVLLIIYPTLTSNIMLIIMGLMFIIPGAIQILRYYIVKRKHSRRDNSTNSLSFPYFSLLCILIGILFIIFISSLNRIFPGLLAAALIFAGAYKIYQMLRSPKKVRSTFYITPSIIIILGLFVFINPFTITNKALVIIFGISAIIYCIDEVIRLSQGRK